MHKTDEAEFQAEEFYPENILDSALIFSACYLLQT